MKKIVASVCLFAVALTAVAQGQGELPPAYSPSDRASVPATIPGISQSQMTPEMYLYLYELRRHEDPKQAVRRKAELKTAQRMQRLAAQKWFGVSNARPMASAQPFMDMYSPRWIGNGYNAFDWAGVNGGGVTVLQIDSNNVRR